jgi:protein gp37
MSDKSKIEWTQASWNCVTGCTKVSAGCDHCYAETFAERWRGIPGHHFEQGFDVRLWPERLDIPRHWKRPRRIFVNSMSDAFHDAVPDSFLDDMFAVMRDCPQHTFQLLTKRHGRMKSYLTRAWPEPLPNVHVGVSAEDQDWAVKRVHALLATPAAVRWVSAEPLLGPIDLRNLQMGNGALIDALSGDVKSPKGEIYAACPGSLSWVVIGGESGPGAREMDLYWARSIIRDCRNTRTAVFMKQVGSVAAQFMGPFAGRKGGEWDAWPDDLQVREYPGIEHGAAA